MKRNKLHKEEGFDLVPLMGSNSWELSPNGIVLETKLGHGAFGDVYRGVIQRGAEETDGINENKIAIKILKGKNSMLTD